MTRKNSNPIVIVICLMFPVFVMTVNLQVNFGSFVGTTTHNIFGTNDVTLAGSDLTWREMMCNMSIRFIRIHGGGLSDQWATSSHTWNAVLINSIYNDFTKTSVPNFATIVQNIPRWPSWFSTDSTGRLNPSEFDAFATWCAQLVQIINIDQRRGVKYWEVTNELVDMYKSSSKLDDLWTIYNKAAAAMRKVDPSIIIGGPADAWDDDGSISQFLQNCPDVGFVSWHAYVTEDTNSLHTFTNDQLMATPARFATSIKNLKTTITTNARGRHIATMFDEYNINGNWNSNENRQDNNIGATWFASVHKHISEAGVDFAASWNGKDGFYGMVDPNNNRRPPAQIFIWSNQHFVGRIAASASDSSGVEVFAVRADSGRRSVYVINKGGSRTTADLAVTGAEVPSVVKVESIDASGHHVGTEPANYLSSISLEPYSVVFLSV